MAIFTISNIAVADFLLCRGKRLSWFPDIWLTTTKRPSKRFFFLWQVAVHWLGFTLLSSEIYPNCCLFGFEAWWTTFRSSGLSFNVDSNFFLSSFPYLFNFACGKHTYLASSIIHNCYQISSTIFSAINNMYVARARQHELQHSHIQISLSSFPVTWWICNVFSCKDHRCPASQVLKETKSCEDEDDSLTFFSLVKALATELARKKSLHQVRRPNQSLVGTFIMGQPSFQASNAIIYLTYGAFLCVRLCRSSRTERAC